MLEAGRVADDVGFVKGAVDGDHALGDDPLDRRVHELDVRFREGAQPRAVVLEYPLPHRRIVGDRLLDEVGPVLEVHRDPRRQLLASLLVLRVDRDPLVPAEGWIDAVRLGAHRDAGIEHEEPEPAGVEGEVLHRPPVTRRHGGVVQRVGQHPLGRPLEDGELLDLVRDGRRDLEPGGAGADECEALAREVESVGPTRRVKGRPGEGVHAGEVGKPRDVQRADGADDETSLEDLRGRVRVPNADVPGARRLVPRERRHFGAEPAVGAELVLVEHTDEVVAQLWLLAEVLGPVV